MKDPRFEQRSGLPNTPEFPGQRRVDHYLFQVYTVREIPSLKIRIKV
jgi:hypothetical protein